MAGRKPVNPVANEARGNPGRRPHPAPAQLPDTGQAEMPEWLNEPARAMWERYAPALRVLGTLRRETEQLFGVWCTEMARYTTGGTTPARIAQIRGLSSSLGMDPSSIGKFATPAVEDENPDDKYFRPRMAG